MIVTDMSLKTVYFHWVSGIKNSKTSGYTTKRRLWKYLHSKIHRFRLMMRKCHSIIQ